jgi:DNA-binding winged helix-turn-helix (wHTH) protein
MHTATPTRFLIGDKEVNLVEQTCEGVAMTEMDSALLTALASRNGEVVTKEELYREVWGYRAVPKGRALDFAIRRLREKIEPSPRDPQFLELVRMRGFRLRWSPVDVQVNEPVAFVPPIMRTSWVGDRHRVEALRARVAASRLLSALGPAGGWQNEIIGIAFPLRARLDIAAHQRV